MRDQGQKYYPPASEASREVANLTERKNPHTKVFVCLSVCLLPTIGLVNKSRHVHID